MISDAARYVGQAAIYGLLALAIGYFSSRPMVVYFPTDKAQIKFSFAHGAKRVEECRRLAPEEIAKLPPRERRPHTCGRERLPMRVQLLVGDVPIYDDVIQPTGLSRDGPARIYRKFSIAPGRHEITARLRDSNRMEGFDYERRVTIELKAQQNLAIDFSSDQGTFTIR
ncbi:hypothetical protein [Hyphomicrobium sp. CS1BSMeth3]|uniref:hypothetical protein n=1 Tax=Hyphomicrobium sp. CS1BSMeth3 TaxID=1892844 RepID=UPI00093019D1|nr:hypothetical protein [Hyphomicrobium sp. CS1BSMeth3]